MSINNINDINELISNLPDIERNTIISASNISDNNSKSHLTLALTHLLHVVTNLVYITSDNANYAYDTVNCDSYTNNENIPQPNTIISANDIAIKHELINLFGKDCICYADCTQFAKWKYYTCACNSDCGCDYFSVNNI